MNHLFAKIQSKVEKKDFIRVWKITLSEFWNFETLSFEHLKTGIFEYLKLPNFLNFKALRHFTHCFRILAVIKLDILKQSNIPKVQKLPASKIQVGWLYAEMNEIQWNYCASCDI